MQILAKPSLFCYLNFLKLHSFIENILLKKKNPTWTENTKLGRERSDKLQFWKRNCKVSSIHCKSNENQKVIWSVI